MKLSYISSLTLLLLISCKDDDAHIVPKSEVDRTVLVYMIGENSLSGYCAQNIDSIISGLNRSQGVPNLLVYEDSYSNEAKLWKISNDPSTNLAFKEEIKDYGAQNSADPEVMSAVINDVFSLYPADEKGLVLWSHGSSWIPSPGFSAAPAKRTFGPDRSVYIELWELRQALEKTPHLDFLAFDACNMAMIETAYELRNVTDCLIASPTEIFGFGFPYQSIVSCWGAEQLDNVRVCSSYMDFYRSTGGSISLYDCSQLQQIVRPYSLLVQGFPQNVADYFSSIQQYGRKISSGSNYCDMYFDILSTVDVLESSIRANLQSKIDVRDIYLADYGYETLDDVFQDFSSAVANGIVYADHTDKFLSIDLSRSQGMGIYIESENTSLVYTSAYSLLQWKQAITLSE